MGRLRREARILATLNHPNIAAICGLEEGAGVVALPAVDGSTGPGSRALASLAKSR